jgi:hypothetical protein
MNYLDCPLCAGHATIDDELTTVRCDGCGIVVDVAPDPGAGRRSVILDEAA